MLTRRDGGQVGDVADPRVHVAPVRAALGSLPQGRLGTSHQHCAVSVDGKAVREMDAHIRERRLESARQALLASRLGVSEIAAHWQYADGSHFSRAFKQRYGLTPTEYARHNA